MSVHRAHQKLSNAPSHIHFGPVASKLRLFLVWPVLAVVFFSQIIIYLDAKSEIQLQYSPIKSALAFLNSGPRTLPKPSRHLSGTICRIENRCCMQDQGGLSQGGMDQSRYMYAPNLALVRVPSGLLPCLREQCACLLTSCLV